MLDVILPILAIFVIYIILTAKKRREDKFYKAIASMVVRGESSFSLNEVYFAAAIKFAQEHGACLPKGKPKFYVDEVDFYLHGHTGKIHVFFHKLPNDGTLIVIPANSKMDKKFSYIEAVKKYGLEELAEVMAIIVRARFSRDPEERMGQIGQFLREEAEAMTKAGGYRAQVAKKLFDDESDYMGAMAEAAEYPVDNPGGPQQTLLKMTFDFMREIDGKSDLPAKFRCAVVENVALIETAAIAMMAGPGHIQMEKMIELKRKTEEADKILGELVRRHEKYFRQFIR